MPVYKMKFLTEIFLELYRSKDGPDGSENKQEKVVAITTKELCEYLKQQTGKAITSNNMKQTYLNELLNNGLIDEEESILDKRQKIYYPLVDLVANEAERIPIYNNLSEMDNLLQHSKIIIPKNCKDIPDNWLNLSILDLLRYSVNKGDFILVDKGNQVSCICRFVREYEKVHKLNGFFRRYGINEEIHRMFTDIKYLGETPLN